MARQKGIIKIQGSIGDLSFYQTKDGFMAKEKSGVDGKRIKNDPAFERTRENGREFSASASAGRLLREAIRPYMLRTADSRAGSRLTSLMSVIKNMDSVSVRGLRNAGEALQQPGVVQELKDFDFNINAPLRTVIRKAYSVDTQSGEISIAQLIPADDIWFPDGATHVHLKGIWARVDFVGGVSEVFESNSLSLLLNRVSTPVSLLPSGTPKGPGTDLFLLKVEFSQVVNGIQYNLKDTSHNALKIVEVA